jgi:hypothetical protein
LIRARVTLGSFGPLDRRVADRIGSHLGDMMTVNVGSGGRRELWECSARASNLGRSSQIGRPKTLDTLSAVNVAYESSDFNGINPPSRE